MVESIQSCLKIICINLAYMRLATWLMLSKRLMVPRVKDEFNEYYSSLAEEYVKYNEWLKEQDPETMTTARGRMEYFKIPFEQRANEYGHVDTDLMFEILKDFDMFDEAYNERM